MEATPNIFVLALKDTLKVVILKRPLFGGL